MAQVALYVRVSTDEQTTANQHQELAQWAERAGHEIVEVYVDRGISGSKGRDKRPGLDKALKDATRRRYDILAVWAVDRLGRSLTDLVATLQELRESGVELFLHRQALDTTTPSGKALFGMLAIFAEFEREMIVERVKAGMKRAREKGTRSGRPIGRAPLDESKARRARYLLGQGLSTRMVAQQVGISKSAVGRLKQQSGCPGG